MAALQTELQSKEPRLMKNTSGMVNGKVALVTGASKGIGAEIARALAAEGAAVVVNYSSSKGAADRVPRRIRVNSVTPGVVATEANPVAAPDSQMRKAVESQTPLGRIGNVDDIAPAVLFFASDQSKWITGETLYITGGFR